MVGTRFGSVMGLASDNLLTGSRGRIRTISDNSSTSTILKNGADPEDPDEAHCLASSEPPCMCDNDVTSKVKVMPGGLAGPRHRIIKTTILYSGIFCLGLQWGVIGPSLPDLEQTTGGSTTYVALILTGRNIASLIGSALAGFLIDRYNNWLLLGGAHVMLGLMFALALWSQELVLLAVCLIPSGIAAGFYDTGVNVAVLRVWIAKPGPWIQAMECIDAIGSLVGPLLAQPFLAHKAANPWPDETDIYLNGSSAHQLHSEKMLTSSHGQDVLFSDHTVLADNTMFVNNSSRFSSIDVIGNYDFLNKSIFITNTTRETSQVVYAYLIVGVLLTLVGAAHLAIFCHERCQLYPDDNSTANKSQSKLAKEHPEERKIRLLILPLLFLICFAYYALETGYAHYLMTFCIKYLNWSKDQGVAVTSVFWGAFTTGTAVGIVIIKYVRPRTMLAFDVTLCLASQIVLAFFLNYHPAIVWGCTIAAGVSISTIFASVFSWTQKNIGVSGKVNALLMVGMATGEMTSPAIIGILIDKSGAISWVYCMVAASALCMTSFICMHILANKRKAIRRDVMINSTSQRLN